MKHLPVLIIALIAVSCGSNNNSKKASAPANAGSERDTYAFETSFRMDDEEQYDALILDCKSGDKSQSFTFEFNWAKDKDYLGEAGAISEDDINADGYPDVVVSLGNFGVMDYMYFYGACLWNEESKQFDLVERYSDIPNAECCVGKSKRLVLGTYSDFGGYDYEDYYDWEDGNLVLAYSDSSSEETLPDDFSWAYGWWKVTENSGTEYESTYEIIINGDTYQSNDGYIRFGYAEEGFYPVYTMPRIPFYVDESEDLKEFFDLQEDDLVLSTSSIGGYEHYIVLNKKTHTIDVDTKCVKVEEERDPEVIIDYRRKLAAIPIEGQWENVKPVSDYMAEYVNSVEVSQYDDNILTKKGNVIELESGNLLSYDKANDQLTIKFSGIEEGESTFTYKRKDAK